MSTAVGKQVDKIVRGTATTTTTTEIRAAAKPQTYKSPTLASFSYVRKKIKAKINARVNEGSNNSRKSQVETNLLREN